MSEPEALNITKSCTSQTFNEVPVLEIFVNLIWITCTSVYSENKNWTQRDLV